MGLLFLYFSIAIIVSFICSILESVFLSLTPAYVRSLDGKNKATHEILTYQKKHTSTTLSAILILNTIAHTVGAAGVGAQAEAIFGSSYMFLVSAILTLGILILSEIIPKTLGTVYHKELAPIAARVLRVVIFISYPLLKLTNLVTNLLPNKKSNVMSKDEMISATLMSEDSGIISEIESDVIENTLKLKDKRVKDILTPRSVVFSVNASQSIKNTVDSKNIFQYSRMPVFKKSKDNIIGVVLVKDLFKSYLRDGDEKLGSICYKHTSVNENVPVSKAMNMMIRKKEHILIVEDSYKQFSGVITLEDCIETILGIEIMDESDEVEDLQRKAKSLNKKS